MASRRLFHPNSSWMWRRGAAVIPQAAHVGRHLRIVGGDQTSVTIGAEILSRIEAERRGDAHGPCAASLIRLASPTRPDRLRSIFDHRQMKFAGQMLQAIHVGTLAVEMNRE